MILASLPSSARRFAALGCVALLVVGCGTSSVSPASSASPSAGVPTWAPTAPPFTLGPSPDATCPTSAPAPFSGTATVTMTTNFGNIVIKVDGSLGANAAGAFVALARCGYYNNILFHRVVPGFVIQAGDGTNARLPNTTPNLMGTGGPSWSVTDDKVTSTYKRGTLAMANKSGIANSGSSQFFVVLTDAGFAGVSAVYSIFGSVTKGMDVVDRIALIPTGGDTGSMPLEPAVITGTTVATP